MIAELNNRGQPGFQPVVTQYVFHKAGNAGDMYGALENERWRDGLAAGVLRGAATSGAESTTWLVLDGPVDPGVLEGMNMVGHHARHMQSVGACRLLHASSPLAGCSSRAAGAACFQACTIPLAAATPALLHLWAVAHLAN